MYYTEKIIVPQKKQEKTHFLAPCLKCGGDDLSIGDYEDEYGVISSVQCKKCKQKISKNASPQFAITEWNNQNHVQTIIDRKKAQIEQLKADIVDLEKSPSNL